jgi:F-type H+-transporting ATPase subunit epsilon
MASTLKLEIVTPTGTAFSDNVEIVTMPGVEGQFGVLPNHVRLITRLVPGELIVRKEGNVSYLAVGEGLVEVTGKRVLIATDMAIPADSIDEAKAEEARQRAIARRKEKLSAAEVASVNASLAHSLAQLKVKRRHRG